MRRALVLGGSGFIGTALCRRLKDEGCWVRSIDNRIPQFGKSAANVFEQFDLRQPLPDWLATAPGGHDFDEVYQLAADLGGAGYICAGTHDADIMASNVRINVNVARAFAGRPGRLLFASSSCVYDDALGEVEGYTISEYDADLYQPSSGYGWEKRFAERIYQAYYGNYGLNVCILRPSTVYGPGSAFDGGRENAVAALCRKVIDAEDGDEIEVWGDGRQVRPLVYIDDLLDAVTRLARCRGFDGPVNIAGHELTSCDEIATQAIALAGKRLTIRHVAGPVGKRALRMSTDLARKHLDWQAETPFAVGLQRTFEWIEAQKARRGLSRLSA